MRRIENEIKRHMKRCGGFLLAATLALAIMPCALSVSADGSPDVAPEEENDLVISSGEDSAADSGNAKKKKKRIMKQVKLTGISNVSGSGKLVLHWKPVRGAAGYRILRKKVHGKKYRRIATVRGSGTSYTDSGRRGGAVYTYKVCAEDDAGRKGRYSRAKSQMAIDRKRKMIALTFDDGPSAHTPVVLRAIKRYRVHATFFVVGSCVNRYAGSLRREAALGCEIGNHTYAHNNLKRLSRKQVRSVLAKTNRVVKKQTRRTPRIMRPPGGNHNAAAREAAGLPVILWSLDTLDWKTRSTSATIQSVLGRAQDGDIVLMHDLHKPTVRAADTIIRKLKARGYQLVTVSELAAYRGGMSAGEAYHCFRK